MADFSKLIERNEQGGGQTPPSNGGGGQPQPQPQPQPEKNYDISQYLREAHYEADPNYVPPAEDYNPYTYEVPQNVQESQQQFAQINYATQEYADDMQRRIIADRNGYMTDDNYQGMLNKTYTNQVYDYIKRANNNADDSAWNKPNPEDDLFSVWLPDWTRAHELEMQAQEKMKQPTPVDDSERIIQSALANTTTDAQRDIMNATNIEHGNWNLMSWQDKAKYLIMPGSSATKMDDAPAYAKWIQNIFPSIMAAGAGAMVGSLIPVPGAGLIGGAIVGGLTYLQGVTEGKVNIPVINKLLEGLDILSVWTEQAQGALGAAVSEAWDRQDGQFDLLELAKTTSDILQDPNNKYLWDAAKYSYEASADLGFDNVLNFVRNTGAKVSDTVFGTNFGQRGIDEVSRANIGRSDVEKVMEGTQGYKSILNTYMPVFTGLVDAAMQQGMSEKEAKEFAHQNMEQYLLNYMGTTGLGRDLVTSSIADPMNLIPYVSAKTSESIGKSMVDRGKASGDIGLQQSGRALQNAGAAAKGNPLIDMLPPVVQQVAEAALSPLDGKKIGNKTINTHGSQGVDTILRTYGNNLGIIDTGKLSDVQKRIAGIDKEGKLKEFNPTKQSGKTDPVNRFVDWARRMVDTTNETKMYEMSSLASNFLGSIFFEGDVKFESYPELVAELVGKRRIADDSPLKPYENSAVLNTLRDGLKNAPDNIVNDIDWDVRKYRQFAENRDVVKSVSDQLKMKPDEIFNALSDKDKDGKQYQRPKNMQGPDHNSPRQKLMDRLRNENITFTDANGKVMDARQILKSMDVFKDDGKRQYSQTYMKANMMEKLTKAIDDYNLGIYGIQPDAWWTRMSNLTKSMQSIALLNFSSSYMVNNFLNNLLTRSAVGVGGVDTDFISTVNQKRGLNFARSEDNAAYQGTGKTIKESKKANDVLAKFDELYNKATDNKVMKGVNNVDIEGMETKAAFDIGCNRYWQSTWETNIPAFPPEFDVLDIDDITRKKIRDIALDSPDIQTFRERMMGEVVIPQAESVFSHMVENNYEGEAAKNIKDTFEKMPWVFDMLNDVMATNDINDIHAGFDRLRDEITADIALKNVIQQCGTFDDMRVNFAVAGNAAIAEAMDNIHEMFGAIWVKQTKQDSTLFLDRLVKKMSREEFNEKIAHLMKIQGEDYNIVRGYAVKYAAAMVEGLGLKTDASIDIMRNVMQQFDSMTEMINERHELFLKYGQADSPDYDYPKFMRDSLDMMKRAQDIQLQADIDLNNILTRHLEMSTNESYKGQIENYKRMQDEIIEAKRKLNAQELKDMEKRLKTSGNEKRYKESRLQEPARVQDKKAIINKQKYASEIYKSIDNASDFDTTELRKPLSMEETLRLDMIMDEAKTSTEKQNEYLKKYDKKKNPADVLKPESYKNTNVNTSFREYGLEEIKKFCEANNLDYQSSVTKLQARFNSGLVVSLGAADVVNAKNIGETFYNPVTKQMERLVVTDHYQLLNPEAKFAQNNSRFEVARSQPFYYNGEIVNAGLYERGKLIGYITSGMKETIEVDGVTYPIIGVSAKDPNTTLVYAKDKIWEVTPGKPKNADFTVYAEENFHPGLPGSTPTVEPWGTAALESSLPIRDALDLFEQQAVSDVEAARANGSVFGNLSPQQRAAVVQYMDNDMRQAYSAQRYQTQRYGETMVDAALLNYNHRYGFDNILTSIMPYQFWMTRSVMNWGRRMITQPAWFSAYARLEKLIEKNKKDFLPNRLAGLIGMPMPNMGDGMGDSLYMDIANIVFPFKQFYNAADYYIGNLRTIHQNTLSTIEEYYLDEKPYNGHIITEDEYNQAIEEGKGEVYDMVFADERAKDETDTSFGGLMGTFLNPNVFVDAIYKHVNNRDKDISYSPMYRLGNLVKATGDKTDLQSITNLIGSGLQMPENALRRAAGIEVNPDGNYKDYYCVQYIGSMLTQKEISYNDAINAIAEGEGNKIYDEALYRYRQQQAIRQQGGAFATEIGQSLGGNKETSVGQIAGSAFASLFGAKIFPEGERQHREQQALKNQYKQMAESGDKESYRKFWKEHPEYTVYNYSYEDDPEKRLHKVLVDNMSNAYYALPESQQIATKRALGGRFNTFFVNPDTRATDYLDDSEIIEWTRAMKGNVPNLTNAEITGPMQQAQQVKWYADSVQGDYDRYKRDFKRLFPGFDTVEDGYYKLPPNQRPEYLVKNPMLQKGWDWQKAAVAANPKLATYITDRSANYMVANGQYGNITQAVESKLNDWTLKQLQNHMQYGWKLNPSAERTLKTVYQSLGAPIPYERWLQSLVK